MNSRLQEIIREKAARQSEREREREGERGEERKLSCCAHSGGGGGGWKLDARVRGGAVGRVRSFTRLEEAHCPPDA